MGSAGGTRVWHRWENLLFEDGGLEWQVRRRMHEIGFQLPSGRSERAAAQLVLKVRRSKRRMRHVRGV